MPSIAHAALDIQPMIPAHLLPSSVYGLNVVQLPLTTHTEPQSSSSSSGYNPSTADGLNAVQLPLTTHMDQVNPETEKPEQESHLPKKSYIFKQGYTY